MQIGDVVKSLKGRDKDSVYTIISIQGQIAYLANGRNRKVQSPKKKNQKHLEVIKKTEDYIKSDLNIRKYCKI